MATFVPVNPRIVKSSAAVPEVIQVKVTSGQSWKQGQFLTTSSGLLVACASGATSIRYLALEDQSDPGNNTTFAKVIPLDDSMVLEMHELDGTLAASNIGVQYGIDVTSNVCTVDVGETTASKLAVEILELGVDYNPLENTSTADVKARCRVKLISNVLEG